MTKRHSGFQLWYIRVFLNVFFASMLLACSPDDGWKQVPEILNNISRTQFPNIDYSITAYGAVGDGVTDCTESIKNAIDSCHANGGGRVVVPEGVYLTGSIRLKSNVNLYISQNATLKFSKSPDDYMPVVLTRFEGVECYNYSPFIYAYKEENIAITGAGTLDGQADSTNWWSWKGLPEYGWQPGKPSQFDDVEALYNMPEQNIPVDERIFGKGHYLRPNFIQPYQCKTVLVDSVTIQRSPMWGINPVLCTDVIVQNVTVNSHGPNNDGCNPESSRNVWIHHCFFNTGDDCIAIKSGRNADGRRINVPSENIVVQDCVMRDGHGGVVIGSEISGNCRNIFAENCIMDSPHLERALRIKTNSLRGGVVENVYMRNITVGQVSDAVIKINFHYVEGDIGEHVPRVEGIYLDNVTSSKSLYALDFNGYERSPISHVVIRNCNFSGVMNGNILNHVTHLDLVNTTLNGSLFVENSSN